MNPETTSHVSSSALLGVMVLVAVWLLIPVEPLFKFEYLRLRLELALIKLQKVFIKSLEYGLQSILQLLCIFESHNGNNVMTPNSVLSKPSADKTL